MKHPLPLSFCDNLCCCCCHRTIIRGHTVWQRQHRRRPLSIGGGLSIHLGGPVTVDDNYTQRDDTLLAIDHIGSGPHIWEIYWVVCRSSSSQATLIVAFVLDTARLCHQIISNTTNPTLVGSRWATPIYYLAFDCRWLVDTQLRWAPPTIGPFRFLLLLSVGGNR